MNKVPSESMAGNRRVPVLLQAAVLSTILALCGAIPVLASSPPKLALFGLELQDTSHEGERDGTREDQQKRLDLLNAEAKKMFSKKGHYELVDISSAAGKSRN